LLLRPKQVARWRPVTSSNLGLIEAAGGAYEILMRRVLDPSRFFTAVSPSSGSGPVSGPLLSMRDGVMFSEMTVERRLDGLREKLAGAQAVNADLMWDFVSALASPGAAGRAGRINRLIHSEAWIEAAFALVELALPQWQPRGLVYQDGGWRCLLGKHRDVPDWLDDTVEASHETLPLAILGALIEARRQTQASASRRMRTVPECPILSGSQPQFMCADNFA
jgi:hypothetical protein